jgi:hypothetical protein
MDDIKFTKIPQDEILSKTFDYCQTAANIINFGARTICKDGVLSPNKNASPALMKTIFQQVQDPDNWKKSISLTTPNMEDAKLILAAIIWHHGTGEAHYLGDGSFLIISPGYSSR